MVSQAIMLALQGVPGIYFHSLFGSHNWQEGFHQTGRARTINRQKLLKEELENCLKDPASQTAKVFSRYLNLLRHRISHPAFHPNATQTVLTGDNPEALFSLFRTSTNGQEKILAINNLSGLSQIFKLSLPKINLSTNRFRDLIGGGEYTSDLNGELSLEVGPYQILWVKPVD